ncbi:RagB/SusD family nutrient uptake outer membrane protein [Dyadobacter psychrotolerans]|uniref:RagB/SusD family nutrient uptake outer membrane protein n=1 Tax=Dyadobacter psychrotolerans TaxID=2541721 RepID=A0A4R5DTZ0_9BACT|nr:RagB/SusD family nutrient uptake outer membrane protein [Dyadobacter psychrotolerans]TDE14635.1 RagB/SusD family nutrient uptake outer membrane protein [Dyadobacter psychrotolerans]
MRKSSLLLGLLLSVSVFTSCSDYLSVELQNALTLEETFNKRSTTEAYLAQIYSFLPNESDIVGGEASVIPRSDEGMFSWLSGVSWLNMNNGSWGPTSTAFLTWKSSYTGINQATIFMNNVDKNVEINQETKDIMKAEARFIRAFLYFNLLRKYGPVYIWGDKDPDITIRPESIDRGTVDDNFAFILSEFDKCIAALPATVTEEAWAGRATKGAVMAAKTRATLYAARPLFNGAEYLRSMINKEGQKIFPQTVDAGKWETAAKAARELIDMNQYSLYTDNTETDPMRKAIKSYQGVFFKFWNSEVIWGRWLGAANGWVVRANPPRAVKEGYGGYAPSLKLVDTYPMAASGRYPVTGYDATGYPIIDSKSGYQEEGFTAGYIHPLDNWKAIRAHNSTVGRDARFYASVLANGFNWYNRGAGDKLITFHTGGTSGYQASGDCVKAGYLWRRMSDPSNNTESGQWGQFCWPTFRLAEIFLSYAEACNEKPQRNEADALLYINKVRNRSGLNNLQVAYPEVIGNQSLLRELIRKERMVEMAFESHRYHDARTWMIAETEFVGPNYTRNLSATNYDDSWKRSSTLFPGTRVFEKKHYFFPINQEQLNEMKSFTQNYGW